MQVKIFSIHHLHTTAYPLWIAAIKQKNEYQKRKYIILYPLLLTLVIHTLNYSFFYTESPSNGDSTAETLNCVLPLKKQIQTS